VARAARDHEVHRVVAAAIGAMDEMMDL
jgi:hypothetical protein